MKSIPAGPTSGGHRQPVWPLGSSPASERDRRFAGDQLVKIESGDGGFYAERSRQTLKFAHFNQSRPHFSEPVEICKSFISTVIKRQADSRSGHAHLLH